MIRDPVCLMTIDLRDAQAMAIREGRAYYFCSEGCRAQFVSEPERFWHNAKAERLSVGVMGSAGNEDAGDVVRRANMLGEVVAERGLTLITGACPGLPYACAQSARERGGLSIGISPALSLDEHLHKYHSPADAFDVLIYTGSGLMGREVTNIRSSDMVIVVGGRSGTLGEFAIAYDEGKLIGVLEDSGGISNEIPAMVQRFDKNTGARLIYDADPVALVDRLLTTYADAHFHRPSCFCNETTAAEG